MCSSNFRNGEEKPWLSSCSLQALPCLTGTCTAEQKTKTARSQREVCCKEQERCSLGTSFEFKAKASPTSLQQSARKTTRRTESSHAQSDCQKQRQKPEGQQKPGCPSLPHDNQKMSCYDCRLSPAPPARQDAAVGRTSCK